MKPKAAYQLSYASSPYTSLAPTSDLEVRVVQWGFGCDMTYVHPAAGGLGGKAALLRLSEGKTPAPPGWLHCHDRLQSTVTSSDLALGRFNTACL